MREKDRHKRQRILQDVFTGYNASSDWPGMAFVDDLLDMYPDVKLVLNKRHSPEKWEESVRSSLQFFSTQLYHRLTYWVPICHWHWQMYRDYMRLAKRRFDVDDVFTAECYERHNQWVRTTAASRGKQVLEWEPEDGWEPLCKFLGREVPSHLFPRTNETVEIAKLKVVLIKKGLLAWAGVLGATLVAVAIMSFFYRSWIR